MRDFASFVDWALIVAPNLAEDEEQASRAGAGILDRLDAEMPRAADELGELRRLVCRASSGGFTTVVRELLEMGAEVKRYCD